jgi:nicotinate phosphoribosyltransferase
VCPELVRNVRRRLDQEGFPWVKIIVSGGFTVEKVLRFQRLRVPFDAVGIGSALFHERIDFTADIVRVDGKPCAKVGRQYKPNPRLRRVS